MPRLYGEAFSIVDFDDSIMKFDKAKLESMLLHPSVKDRKIVTFSIAGAFRKGKSYFLDYCLRYFYGNFKSILNPDNKLDDCECWMGHPDDPLKGFSWRSGIQRDTTGIIFWSDVFLHDQPNGDKLAILVVDTQGLFDHKSSTSDNSKIFSLATLLSSVQILNLSGVVGEDHLEYLQFVAEYARFIMNHNQDHYKPFQKFVFLVRDWSNPEDFAFGFEGGQKYLEDLLLFNENQPDQLQQVRTFIKKSFDSLSCSLLPYPGKIVARDSTYLGNWGFMDEDFREEIKLIIPNLLRAENLVIKKINNIEVNGATFNQQLQQFISLFQSSKTVVPKSAFESTIEKFMMAAVDRSFEMNQNQVNMFKNSIVNQRGIDKLYNLARDAAFLAYRKEPKMGTPEHDTKFHSVLDEKIETSSMEWKTIAIAAITRVGQERDLAQEAVRETARIKLKQIQDLRTAQAKFDQTKRENEQRERENERNREKIRKLKAELQRY